MRTLADKSVDHVICDPPYSQSTHERTWVAKAIGRPTVYDRIDFAAITDATARDAMWAFARVAKRWIVAFTDLENIDMWRKATLSAGLDYVRCGIWVKPDATPQFTGDRPAQGAEAFVIAHAKGKKRWNGGGKRNVYTHTRTDGPQPHPTTKPLSLMLDLVADFADPGDLVLDPFAGSGTTGVACRQLGRRFVGWEMNAEYYEIACRRLRGDEAKPNPAQTSMWGAR
jgi:DNA modification methylase